VSTFYQSSKVLRFGKNWFQENCGQLVDENDLNNPNNLDTVVINFGPLNKAVFDFLEVHKQELYSPALIFEAMGRGYLCRDDQFISVDRHKRQRKTRKLRPSFAF